MNRIAFTLPDVGLREVKGMVYVEDGFLMLSIEDALLGFIDRERVTVQIDPPALEDLRIRKGLVRDRLVITPRRADLLDLVPGEHRAAVELRVSRRHRADLEALAEAFHALG